MRTIAALGGIALVTFVLFEAFEALVLPRRVLRPFRLTRMYYILSWHGCLYLSRLIPVGHNRQSFLSVFGPLSLLILFGIWIFILIIGFGFLQFGFAPTSVGFLESMYLSGATFTTLGYGDVVPATPHARVLCVAEAATGLGFFAIVISYLPVLYQSFGRREAFIAQLDARAGSPPAAGRLLHRIPPHVENERCLTDFLSEAERWAAELLEGHLSFPVLGQYRSQHDNQSWLAALACTLDATALLLTVVDGVNRTRARLTFAMARHVVVDLSLVIRNLPAAPMVDRLSPERLTAMLAVLKSDGVVVRDDAEARDKLIELRQLYEPFVAGLAHYYRLSVPDMWPTDERPDNWQTSAWQRRAAPLKSLGVDPKDEHFS